MNDRLQQLALFVRTVEAGNFSKAARAFGLSQPSASRAIAALERRLGVKLIARTTRQISLTAPGEALLERAREALAAIDDAENAARGADRLSGVLRVALPPGYGAWRIVPLLPAFLDRHPLLKLDLMMSDRYENLIAEGADLAIRIGEQAEFELCRAEARKREAAFRREPPLSRNARQAREPGRPRRPRFHRRPGRREHPEARRAPQRPHRGPGRGAGVAARSAAGIAACAVAGLGVAVGSASMCAEGLRSGALAPVLSDYALDPVDAYVVFPSGRRTSQRSRAFADYLERVISAGRNKLNKIYTYNMQTASRR